MDPRRAALHRRALRGAALRLSTSRPRAQQRVPGSPIPSTRVSFPLADSLTELHAARLLTYHAAHAFDTLSDRSVVHGKVAMAKLYASEMAGEADRAVVAAGAARREPSRTSSRAAGIHLEDERDPALGDLPRGAAPPSRLGVRRIPARRPVAQDLEGGRFAGRAVD
jgi:alkylation response protein AidB-like acyl-CoA dehydrogenase